MREGFPARQHGHGVRVDQLRGGGTEVLRLAVGGRDGEHGAVRPVVPSERGGEERAQRRRPLDAQGGQLRRVQLGVEHGMQVGLGEGGAEQAGKLGHDRVFPLGWAHADRPLPGTRRGLAPGYAAGARASPATVTGGAAGPGGRGRGASPGRAG